MHKHQTIEEEKRRSGDGIGRHDALKKHCLCVGVQISSRLQHKSNIMANRKMTEDELRWQAESDARTIEQYNEIINDKPRLDRAMKAAKKQVENLTERANALNKSITGIKRRK